MTAYAFPCARHPEWFDTGKGRETKAVRKALRICETCPVMLACRRAGREGREWGIWGGETQTERWTALGISEADLIPPPCGTEKASSRHRELGETCQTCLEAEEKRKQEADEAAEERRRKRKEFEEIPGSRVNPFHAPLRPVCGTYRGYRAHEKRGELRMAMHPECTCKEACRIYRAEKRAAEKDTEVEA